MTAKPQFSLADALLLLRVVAVAAGARAGYLLAVADGGQSAGPLLVQDSSPVLRPASAEDDEGHAPMPTELGALAHSLRYQFEFASPAPLSGGEREATAHVAPGYPFLVSLVDRVVPDDSVGRAVRWGQAGLGALTAGLYFLFGWYAFRSRSVALLAGLFCALHPFWIVNTAALEDGTVTAFMLGLVLYTGAVASRDAAAFHSLLFGLALAGLALLRAALLPFAFVTLVWFLWRSRRLDRGWLCALLAFLGFVNGLAPWTIRNFQAYDEPVPVVDSTYLHLYMGNNLLATGGPQTEERLLEALAQERGV